MSNLYKRIIDLCDEKGIKGAKLCSDTKISKGLLTDLKMGRRQGVSAKTAQKIASYFNVSVEYLIGASDEKEKSPVVSNEASDIDIKILDALKQLSEEQKAQALDFALFLANNSKK